MNENEILENTVEEIAREIPEMVEEPVEKAIEKVTPMFGKADKALGITAVVALVGAGIVWGAKKAKKHRDLKKAEKEAAADKENDEPIDVEAKEVK